MYSSSVFSKGQFIHITWLMLPLFVLGLCACTPSSPDLSQTPESTIAHVPTITPSPPPTNTPFPTPTPEPLNASEIFNKVSPSIAFIETPHGSGSAILIENGYVLTNAHVIWPYKTAKIVFPNNVSFEAVPVVGWDWMIDLALLGPIETDLPSLELVNGEDRVIGSDVYLIGYPGEVEKRPQATITRGLISRIREWNTLNVTYFQTDAKIAGGQSGGALVSENGDVIGVSTFSFTEDRFGLVTSANDIIPHLTHMISNKDGEELDQRGVQLDEETTQSTYLSFRHPWETVTYVINEPVGTKIELDITNGYDLCVYVSDIYGRHTAYEQCGDFYAERITFTIRENLPHIVRLNCYYQCNPIKLESNYPLQLFKDPDDGRMVSATKSPFTFGVIDYASDHDYYLVILQEGEELNVRVESAMIDAFLQIDFKNLTMESVICDDDSGGGLFGENAELTYRAPHHGLFVIVVSSYNPVQFGGYVLTVQNPDITSPTPVAPPPTATPTIWKEQDWQQFTSTDGKLSILYPITWEEGAHSKYLELLCDESVSCFTDGEITLLVQLDKIPDDYGFNITQDELLQVCFAFLEELEDITIIQPCQNFLTDQGILGVIYHIKFDYSEIHMKHFDFLKDGFWGKVLLITSSQFTEFQWQLAHIIFKTVRIDK
jgi:S1-C subfamily serine protease